MKCNLRYYIFFVFFFIFAFFSSFTCVNAEGISPTTIRVKSSDNSQVLADESLDFFTNTPYYAGQIELPFSSPTLQYNTSYGIDLYVDFYVSYYNDWGNFGLNSPGVYILYNGLQGQALNYNVFSNELQDVSNVVGYYRLHLSGTFATNSQGTLYIALPFSHAIDLYGAKVVSVDLNYYGSNTTNSDIIASNNQNTQNVISNNNQNTQQIINNNNSNSQAIIDATTDDTPVSNATLQAFIDDFPVISNGPISGILQLPLRILDYLTTIFTTRNCISPISLGTLYGHEIKLTCIDIESKIGSNIYDMIDYVGAILVWYLTLMTIISSWETWTSFNDEFNSLYVGKHTKQGYTPRHGG